MKEDKIKYIVSSYWKDNSLEHTDWCRSERYMITCVKRALSDGYKVEIKKED